MISKKTKLFLVEGGGGGGGGALVFSFGGCGALRVFLDFFGLETTLKIVWTIYVQFFLGKNYESNHFLQINRKPNEWQCSLVFNAHVPR